MNAIKVYNSRQKYSDIKAGDIVQIIGAVKGYKGIEDQIKRPNHLLGLNIPYKVSEIKHCTDIYKSTNCTRCNHYGKAIFIYVTDTYDRCLCFLRLANKDGVEYLYG